MVKCKLMIVLLISVLQMCTAKPVTSEEEINVAKLFTADELQRAKDNGFLEPELVRGKSKGFTLDEMIKLRQLRPIKGEDYTFEFVSKVCEVLTPGHRMASNYTGAQADELKSMIHLMRVMTHKHELPFIRTKICGFVSDPDMHPFGSKLYFLLKIRFDSHISDDVSAAELMCCIDEGGDNIEDRTTNLRDEDMNEFKGIWNNFDTMDVPKSTENLCNFLRSRNLANRCQKSLIPSIRHTK